MRPAVKVARIVGASRHSRLETKPSEYGELQWEEMSPVLSVGRDNSHSLRVSEASERQCTVSALPARLANMRILPKKATFYSLQYLNQ